jgi:hypothetical protein
MNRTKVTDILNRMIDLQRDVYDLSHTEEDSQSREGLSRTLDYLEKAESLMKEILSSPTKNL